PSRSGSSPATRQAFRPAERFSRSGEDSGTSPSGRKHLADCPGLRHCAPHSEPYRAKPAISGGWAESPTREWAKPRSGNKPKCLSPREASTPRRGWAESVDYAQLFQIVVSRKT